MHEPRPAGVVTRHLEVLVSDKPPAATDDAVVDAQTRPHDGGTTLTEVIEGYCEAGFTGSFSAVEGALVECHQCNTRSAADSMVMSSLRRLEGASDPADM